MNKLKELEKKIDKENKAIAKVKVEKDQNNR